MKTTTICCENADIFGFPSDWGPLMGFFEENANDIPLYASEHELNSVNNHLLYSTKFRERQLSMTTDNHILAIPCIKTISVSTCHNMSI